MSCGGIHAPHAVDLDLGQGNAGQRAGRNGAAGGKRQNGTEAPTALLTDPSQAIGLFGRPRVPLAQMIDWVADWVAHDRPSLNSPTHFEVRDGVY